MGCAWRKSTENLARSCSLDSVASLWHFAGMVADPHSALGPFLTSGERLIWAGQPLGGFRLRAHDFFLIPFSLLWGGFAFFWEFMAITSTPGDAPLVRGFFALFGLPFVLIGIYLIVGRFWVDARMRARTYYGITNERVIILRGLLGLRAWSVDLEKLGDVELFLKADGTGNISLGVNSFAQSSSYPFSGNMSQGRRAIPCLEMVREARFVHDLLRKAQRELRERARGFDSAA